MWEQEKQNVPSEIMSVHSAVLMFPDKNILDAIWHDEEKSGIT